MLAHRLKRRHVTPGEVAVWELKVPNVRFSSGKVSVNLTYWPESPEGSVEVEVREAGGVNADFFLDDFGFAAGLGTVFDYGRFDLRAARGVSSFLQAAAALLRVQGDAVLRGDSAAVLALRTVAEERERVYVEALQRGRPIVP